MNTFDLVCAVLSNATYHVGRDEKNWTPPYPGAVELTRMNDPTTGFEATAYSYQGRIIIAYAGTDTSQIQDIQTNLLLGLGVAESQIKQAALFYEQIKKQYGDASGSNITLTGHSLGGGLAALMGVMFNKDAVTADLSERKCGQVLQ